MTSEKKAALATWLESLAQPGNEAQVQQVVLLLTLVIELFAPDWFTMLHTQNMSRAKHGRNSVEAYNAGVTLRAALGTYANKVKHSYVCAEACKHEFIKCNPKNAWSAVKPAEKAVEELKELVNALKVGDQHSERVLDAILDAVYAGTEVKGVHC